MSFLQHLFSPLLQVVTGVILSLQLFMGLFGSHLAVTAPSGTTTPQTIIANATTTPFVPSPITATTTATTSTKVAVTIVKKVSSTETTTVAASTPTETQTAPVSQTPSVSPDAVNAATRGALVNILCTSKSGGSFEPISGSGVIVDSRGIILTNAHVAQYFLLANYPTPGNVDCVIRTGSPAEAAYTAELLYLPPAWVATNASQITATHETGTGQNDYAFLLITGTTDGSPLPASFPSIPMTINQPQEGENILLASYPAGFLSGETIQEDLYATSAYDTVGQLYSFTGTQVVDLVSLGGTVNSQPGSSGGAMVRLQDGALQGIIVTDTTGTTTADRDLNALTLSFIDRGLTAEGITGGIAGLLSTNVATEAQDYNQNIAPSLTEELVKVLQG